MSTGITPLNPQQTATGESQVDKEGYVEKELVGLDQFLNVTTGGLPDETISSRMACWATEDKGVKGFFGRMASKGLDLFQKDHGAQAEVGDYQRAVNVENAEKKTGDLSL